MDIPLSLAQTTTHQHSSLRDGPRVLRGGGRIRAALEIVTGYLFSQVETSPVWRAKIDGLYPLT